MHFGRLFLALSRDAMCVDAAACCGLQAGPDKDDEAWQGTEEDVVRLRACVADAEEMLAGCGCVRRPTAGSGLPMQSRPSTLFVLLMDAVVEDLPPPQTALRADGWH